jgi:hypothetical protein
MEEKHAARVQNFHAKQMFQDLFRVGVASVTEVTAEAIRAY